MISWSTTVTVLLAVASSATATTCGDLKWACCNIPDNDPNGGTCKDPSRMACWEGFCKPCGTDGMPACAGPTPCTGKNIIHVGTFCTFDTSKIPKPATKPAAKPATKPATKPARKSTRKPKAPKVKGPRRDRTVRTRKPKAPRGTVKAPKPSPPPKAAVKAPPTGGTCGDLKWACCDIPDNDPNAGTCKDPARMACWEGFCKPCGTDGMPVCAGATPCKGKLVVDHNNFCTFNNGSY